MHSTHFKMFASGDHNQSGLKRPYIKQKPKNKIFGSKKLKQPEGKNFLVLASKWKWYLVKNVFAIVANFFNKRFIFYLVLLLCWIFSKKFVIEFILVLFFVELALILFT